MCCFSRPVESVSDTKIFARGSDRGRQFVVYSMALDASEELAMVLPLPVAKESGEDALRFISLKEYPDFFVDLQRGFPVRSVPSRTDTFGASAPLKVVDVGDFEASFVPTVRDFSRLDERFRLPTEVWDRLPQYKDYGFAVFQLKPGAQRVHPMAFEFPRANPRALFFPTVHIHDGEVHRRADFDHTLYCQTDNTTSRALMDWDESHQPAGMFVDAARAEGLIDPATHCYRLRIKGSRKNEDIVVKA
jgi:hypothetical protein